MYPHIAFTPAISPGKTKKICSRRISKQEWRQGPSARSVSTKASPGSQGPAAKKKSSEETSRKAMCAPPSSFKLLKPTPVEQLTTTIYESVSKPIELKTISSDGGEKGEAMFYQEDGPSTQKRHAGNSPSRHGKGVQRSPTLASGCRVRAHRRPGTSHVAASNLGLRS